MRNRDKKLLDQAQKISAGRAVKAKDGFAFTGSYSTQTPQDQFKKKIQEELEHQLYSGPVRKVTEGIGTAEKMTPLEIKRMQVIIKIKKNPRLRSNDFLRQCLNQKRPLTECQCDAALKVIGAMNSRIRAEIEDKEAKENK